jgi:hypothetical protein
MKSKQIRLPIELLNQIEKKLLREGHSPQILKAHLPVYIVDLLWKYVKAEKE